MSDRIRLDSLTGFVGIGKSFFYGRSFANDADLNSQARTWLDDTANVRVHGTLGQRPIDRFDHDEKSVLKPLARKPYPWLSAPKTRPASESVVAPTVTVQRRSLQEYGRLAESGQ